ncbi:MAG: hypothetical protein DRJ10_16360 [Bacteroidetes bacterium]|nr:MAG: hypothetical protein DRJ10_16360 [Bacteroidota bacterium]
MQNYTLTISENSSKAIALLNYLKSIDFVKISKSTDWWDSLTSKEQNSINKSVKLLDKGKGITHDDVRRNVNNLLGKDE